MKDSNRERNKEQEVSSDREKNGVEFTGIRTQGDYAGFYRLLITRLTNNTVFVLKNIKGCCVKYIF